MVQYLCHNIPFPFVYRCTRPVPFELNYASKGHSSHTEKPKGRRFFALTRTFYWPRLPQLLSVLTEVEEASVQKEASGALARWVV